MLSTLDVGFCVSKGQQNNSWKVREAERRQEVVVSTYVQKESTKIDI